jgi:hypothetical protein
LYIRWNDRISGITQGLWDLLGRFKPARAWFDAGVPLNPQELGDMNIAVTTAILFVVCSGWYFLSMLFAGRDSEDYRHADAFFKEMNTPVDPKTDHIPSYDNDARQYNVLGNLCLIYGGFILLIIVLPNEPLGYVCLAACGGIIGAIGFVLRLMGRRVALRGALAEGITPEMHQAAVEAGEHSDDRAP